MMICKINNESCNNCKPYCDQKMEDRKERLHNILEKYGNEMYDIGYAQGYREGYLKALEDVLATTGLCNCPNDICNLSDDCCECVVILLKQKFQGEK